MNLFTRHPASIGETYGEHLAVAFGFGARMIAGGAACCLHALLPFAFERTGSQTVATLYAQMVEHRAARSVARRASEYGAFGEFDWAI